MRPEVPQLGAKLLRQLPDSGREDERSKDVPGLCRRKGLMVDPAQG